MKRIIQTNPTVGSASLYRPNEWIRTADRGLYLEVEIPVPTHERTGPPEVYLLLNLFPRQGTSIALAVPSEGIHEMIEFIQSKKEYELAFRRKWPLLDSLLVDDQHVVAEFAKRPVLLTAQDPDDRWSKWMVGRQVTVPANAPNTRITDDELKAAESLIVPAVSLQTEARDAYSRVASAFVEKELAWPKSNFEKFMDGFKEVMEAIKPIVDALRDSGLGR